MPLQLEIVSPTRLLVSRSVDMVVMPAYEGDLAAQPQHAPMITLLRGGVISIYDGASVSDRYFVYGGFAEITPDRCTILADEILTLDELNVQDAHARLHVAEQNWAEVDKVDIIARDAALDALQSTREAVRVASSN
jgi:F-type H+-transporting ATPase subunit epsilon